MMAKAMREMVEENQKQQGWRGEDGFVDNATNQKNVKQQLLQFWSALTGKIERRLVLRTLTVMTKTMEKVAEENQKQQGWSAVITAKLWS